MTTPMTLAAAMRALADAQRRLNETIIDLKMSATRRGQLDAMTAPGEGCAYEVASGGLCGKSERAHRITGDPASRHDYRSPSAPSGSTERSGDDG